VTTYSGLRGLPYKEPESIEEWLEKIGIAQAYATVFTWETEKVHSEYEELFDRVEASTERINSISSEFQQISQVRLEYMQKNGIEKWSDLDSGDDAEHLAMKEKFSEDIRVINSKGNNLKKVRSETTLPLALLTGIIDGSYTNFDSIIDDERRTHGIMSSNSGDPLWQVIGPIHNMFGSMYPKLVFG
jgi:hypothetical protein